MPHDDRLSNKQSPHQPRWVHGDGQHLRELSTARWPQADPVTPGTTPWSPAPRIDTALVKAVVRAHRWRQMLESGEYNSSAELAKAEKVNDSYLCRILRLTLIAPGIIEAILTGRQPSTLQLDDLLKPLPAAWELQHSALFGQQ
jgi:hypothetical protein